VNRCQFITASTARARHGLCRSAPLGGSLSTPARHIDGCSRGARPTRMPTACLVKPVAARTDFLGPTWDSPIRGLRVQPAATGGPGRAPSGTRLGTKRSSEVPNCNRIRSLEGRRPRISDPVLLQNVRGFLILGLRARQSRTNRLESTIGDQRPRPENKQHQRSRAARTPLMARVPVT
jgi:hypothetical protein